MVGMVVPSMAKSTPDWLCTMPRSLGWLEPKTMEPERCEGF
jgi:hypothetical protein